jgi:hypothetical protein
VSAQPSLDDLNHARVQAELIDRIALGRAVRKCEAHAIPLTHDTLNRLANEWKTRPMTPTELAVLERITR